MKLRNIKFDTYSSFLSIYILRLNFFFVTNKDARVIQLQKGYTLRNKVDDKIVLGLVGGILSF